MVHSAPVMAEERPSLNAKNYLRLPVPAADRVDYADPALPGFYLRVSATGARTFVIRYRLPGKPQRRYTLGQVPPLEYGKTRERARRLLQRVKLGGEDPVIVDAIERGEATPATAAAPDLAALAGSYIEAREQDQERPLAASTAREYRALIKRHLKSEALRGPVAQLTRGDVKAYLRTVATDSGRTEANRLFALGRATCRWAIGEDSIERQPFEGLKTARSRPSGRRRPPRSRSRTRRSRIAAAVRTRPRFGYSCSSDSARPRHSSCAGRTWT
jgi:Arm DNA-binding domain